VRGGSGQTLEAGILTGDAARNVEGPIEASEEGAAEGVGEANLDVSGVWEAVMSALGQPNEALGQPSEALGQPSEALGQPSEALGLPSEVGGGEGAGKGAAWLRLCREEGEGAQEREGEGKRKRGGRGGEEKGVPGVTLGLYPAVHPGEEGAPQGEADLETEGAPGRCYQRRKVLGRGGRIQRRKGRKGGTGGRG